jgi:nucleoside-diphosphate-sugar epimerase
MRYFLTGATGFIGHVLSRQLAEAGHEIITVARRPDRDRLLVGLGVDVVRGDITDKNSLREAMRGVDGVFHVAAWYKIGANAKESREAEKINVEGTRNVLELMKELKIRKGVYTSTLAVFSDTHGKLVKENHRYHGPWLTEYDRTKWIAHFEVAVPMMEEHLPLVIVQPGLVYGPGDTSAVHSMLQLYLRRRLLVSPKRTAFCWGHVEDTAQAHILAMEKGKSGETYIVAGPVHTLVEALAMAEKITGVPAPKRHPGPGAMRFMAGLMYVVGRVTRLPAIYTYEGLRSMAGVTYIGSNERAVNELGFSPRQLEAGLRETLEHEKLMLARGHLE